MSFVGRRKTWPGYRSRGGIISSKWAYQDWTEKIWAFLVLVQEGPLPATVFGRTGFGYYESTTTGRCKQTNKQHFLARWPLHGT
jgi:hypothetical protein